MVLMRNRGNLEVTFLMGHQASNGFISALSEPWARGSVGPR